MQIEELRDQLTNVSQQLAQANLQNTQKQILQARVSDDAVESYTPQQYRELQAKLTQLDLTNQRLRLQVHQQTEQLESGERTITQLKQERVNAEK